MKVPATQPRGAVLRGGGGGATRFEGTDKRAESGGSISRKELGVTLGVIPGAFHVHLG